MELSYHPLSWYLQKSLSEKKLGIFFWVIQLIRYIFVNHLEVEGLYFICNNKSLLHKLSYIWDKNAHIYFIFGQNNPIFLVTVG